MEHVDDKFSLFMAGQFLAVPGWENYEEELCVRVGASFYFSLCEFMRQLMVRDVSWHMLEFGKCVDSQHSDKQEFHENISLLHQP
jgi:hypothetical protein